MMRPVPRGCRRPCIAMDEVSGSVLPPPPPPPYFTSFVCRSKWWITYKSSHYDTDVALDEEMTIRRIWDKLLTCLKSGAVSECRSTCKAPLFKRCKSGGGRYRNGEMYMCFTLFFECQWDSGSSSVTMVTSLSPIDLSLDTVWRDFGCHGFTESAWRQCISLVPRSVYGSYPVVYTSRTPFALFCKLTGLLSRIFFFLAETDFVKSRLFIRDCWQMGNLVKVSWFHCQKVQRVVEILFGMLHFPITSRVQL